MGLGLKSKFGKHERLISLTVISILALSLFVVLYNPDGGVVSANVDSYVVSVSGPSKLFCGEVGEFVANVNSSCLDGLNYVWSISPCDGKTLLVSDGAFCNLTFTVATGDYYVLNCTVNDKWSGSIVVQDPYNQPDLYLGVYGQVYTYMVQSDGAGWYQAIDGVTGQVLLSSTDASYVEEMALGNSSSGNVWLNEVSHDLSLSIPVGVAVVESVDGLERTFINSADRVTGIIIISTDGTYCFAQDSAKRYLANLISTNSTVTIQVSMNIENDVLAMEGTYVVSGLQIFYAPTNLSCSLLVPSNTYFHGENREKTVIKWADAQSTANVLGAWQCYNSTVSDLTIDGNVAGNTYLGKDGGQAGFYCRWAKSVAENLIFKNCPAEGLYMGSQDGSVTNNIWAYNCGLIGVHLSSSDRSTLTNVYCDGCGVTNNSTGVAFDDVHNCKIDNIHAINGYKGISMQGGDNYVSDDYNNNVGSLYSANNTYYGMQIGSISSTFDSLFSYGDAGSYQGAIRFYGLYRSTINYVEIRNPTGGTGIALNYVNDTVFQYLSVIDTQTPVLITTTLAAYAGANNTVLGGDFSHAGGIGYYLPSQCIVFQNVVGINNKGFSITTPSMPLSEVSYQNQNPFTVKIFITDVGTVTSLNVTDVFGASQVINTTLFAGQELTLNSQCKIAITYSVAPSWKWYGV